MEFEPCVRCGKALKQPKGITATGDQQLAFYIHAVTVGLRPRVVSKAKRLVICAPCSVSMAMGPEPQSGAFNSAVYETVVEIDKSGQALSDAAREQKYNPHAPLRLMPGSKPDETLATPALKAPAFSAAS